MSWFVRYILSSYHGSANSVDIETDKRNFDLNMIEEFLGKAKGIRNARGWLTDTMYRRVED